MKDQKTIIYTLTLVPCLSELEALEKGLSLVITSFWPHTMSSVSSSVMFGSIRMDGGGCFRGGAPALIDFEEAKGDCGFPPFVLKIDMTASSMHIMVYVRTCTCILNVYIILVTMYYFWNEEMHAIYILNLSVMSHN